MDSYPHLYHPENTRFGSGSNDGKFELLNPFKVQQPINTKARRDARMGLYNAGRQERHSKMAHHFRTASTNPHVTDVYPNEIIWRFRDPEPMTFPEGDIREYGFSALNGLSPLQYLKPIGVAASGSITPGLSGGDGMTDFGVTESGLVSVINNSKFDIMAGDYVAAIFPSDPAFTKQKASDERRSDAHIVSPKRDPITSHNPVGLPADKLMAAIVPINRLIDNGNPDACIFAASMNGMFVVPKLTKQAGTAAASCRCILPTYLREQFAQDPHGILTRIQTPDDELRKHCFPPNSDIMHMDIWHNFGLGKALNGARSGQAFQCLLGAPFDLNQSEWELSDDQLHQL